MLLSFRSRERRISYCPFLYPLVANLLIYFNPSEVYHILLKLNEDDKRLLAKAADETGPGNQEENLSLGEGPFFLACKESIAQLISSFFQSYEVKVKEVHAGMQALKAHGIEAYSLMKRLMDSFFTQVFPYVFVDQVVICYLTHGVSALLTLYIVFFVFYRAEIAESANKCELREAINKRMAAICKADIEEMLQLFCKHRVSGRLPLQKKEELVEMIEGLRQAKPAEYAFGLEHCPKVKGQSKFALDRQRLYQLYQSLPPILRLNNLKLIYANWRDGSSFSSIVEKGRLFPEAAQVCLVRTIGSEEFGFFLSRPLRATGENFETDLQSFLFVLGETVTLYKDCGSNSYHYKLSSTGLEVGLSETGVSLCIEDGLHRAFTQSSTTYGNPPLVGKLDSFGGFEIQFIELFVLV